MKALELYGRARRFGNDINTDYIITSRRKRESLDPQVLRQYLFEEIDARFARTVEPGDVIVAGRNFGCGSAMEVAVTAVLAAGIRAVLAASFSRTYFRNAINNGLLPILCDTERIGEGQRLQIHGPGQNARSHAGLTVENLSSGEAIRAAALPAILLSIFEAGGLVPYLCRYGDFQL
jgi:3-isopropylmalate/(R)-2-methylmalate dehydratase small subunit